MIEKSGVGSLGSGVGNCKKEDKKLRSWEVKKPQSLNFSVSQLPKFSLLLLTVYCILFFAGCAGRWAYHRGDGFASQGKWDEAVIAFTEALSKDPGNIEYNIRLIMAKERAAESHYQKGTVAVLQDKLDDAVREFQMAVALNSAHDAADSEMKKAIRIKESRIHYELGLELEKQGKFSEAMSEFQAALRIDPKNIKAKTAKEAASERQKKALEAQLTKDRAEKPLYSTKPITLQLRDVQLKQAFEILAKTVGVSIFFDEGVRDVKTSFFIKDNLFSHALELMLRTNNLFKKQVDDNTILIIPDTPAKRKQYEDLLIQIFYLSNADAKKAVNMLRTLLNIRQVHVNEELNALVVRETAEKMELVKKLIDVNDKADAEIYLELELLEVNRSKLREIGLKLSQYSVSAGIAPSGGSLGDILTLGILKDLTDSNYLFSIPYATINFAKSEGLVKTLANPRIRVLNRKKARFAIADRVPVAISTTTVSQTSTTGTTPEYKEVGVKMDFVPTVHTDTNEITLEVKLEVSSLGEKVTLQSEGKSTEAYTTRSRNAETFLRLKDGDKAVLAGLISDTERTSASKIPFLSDIPVLGALFTATSDKTEETDILMSITPRIIRAMEVLPDENQPIQSGREETYTGGTLPPVMPPTMPMPPHAPSGAPEEPAGFIPPPPPPPPMPQ